MKDIKTASFLETIESSATEKVKAKKMNIHCPNFIQPLENH